MISQRSPLIESWMPAYDHAATYQSVVQSSPDSVFHSLLHSNLSKSWILRLLLGLRGLSFKLGRTSLKLTDMTGMGFVELERKQPTEIVFGLVGRFWTLNGDIQRISSGEFKSFSKPGFGKVVWNFRAIPADEGTVLSTETRIQCTDEVSRKFFNRYWRVIGPFSGITRKEMLRIIKREAERQILVK